MLKKQPAGNEKDQRRLIEEEVWALLKKIETSSDDTQQAAFREQIWRLGDRRSRQRSKD